MAVNKDLGTLLGHLEEINHTADGIGFDATGLSSVTADNVQDAIEQVDAWLGGSFTAGSVIFSDGTGFAQDNTNFFYNSTDNRLGVGEDATTTTFVLNGATVASVIKSESNNSSDIAGIAEHKHNNTAGIGSSFIGIRSRGTHGAETVVQSGDRLLSIAACGYDGTDYAIGGSILFEVDGTPGSNDMPGRIILSTTADGASSETEAVRISSTQVTKFAQSPTAPGAGANSERFGLSAVTTGAGSLAIGNAATATPTDSTVVGNSASVGSVLVVALGTSVAVGKSASCASSLFGAQTAVGGSASAANAFCTAVGAGAVAGTGVNNNATAVGYGASATGASAFSMGFSAVSTGGASVAVGANTNASGTGSIAFGDSSTCANNYSMSFGVGASTNATNQLAIGGTNPMNTIRFGNGAANTAPSATATLSGTYGTGTNITASALVLAAGAGTGNNATNQYVEIQTPTVGSSGATQQTLTKRLRVNQVPSTGLAGFQLVDIDGVAGVSQGTATSTYSRVGGAAKVNTTSVGNVGAGEDDLMTYSVPANSLSTNGDFLEFSCAGTFAANVNNKRIRVKFGATTIVDTTALAINGGSWRCTGTIVRTGAATQKCSAVFTTDNALLVSTAKYVTAAETLSGAVTFKCTGEATSNNDIVQEIQTVKWFPNA
jgi:hypothetical protein